jgi:protein-disulfide isomerase
VHPFAMRAALYGACVRSEQGDPAYFTYQKAVFSHQESLTIADAEKTLIAAATAAGASPTAVATCVDSAAAKTSVEAGIQLANELGVDQTPVLEVNGHLLPLSGVPYDTLRKIVAYQANQDGIPVHLQPLLTNLK